MTREVAKPDPEIDPASAAFLGAMAEWREATENATLIISYDVAKDEYLTALVGIDMVVTGVIYRPGIRDSAYVSLECLLSPVWELPRINRARKANGLEPIDSLDRIPWDPAEHVVINDGGTGIYRQMTEYLYRTNVISLPEPVVESGKRGECSFDLPPEKWSSARAGDYLYLATGRVMYTNKNINIRCRKGIRVSNYSTDFGDATTYYLA